MRYLKIDDQLCGVHDVTNNIRSTIDLIPPKPLPLISWFSEKEPPLTVHDKNKFVLEIRKCDSQGEMTNESPLARGSGNIVSYVQWDGKVYWKVTQPWEKWDLDAHGLNPDNDSSKNKDYLAAVRAKK
jgi:hypothetical protein